MDRELEPAFRWEEVHWIVAVFLQSMTAEESQVNEELQFLLVACGSLRNF